MVDFTLNPARTALLNIDMQSVFVADSPVAPPDGLELLERINGLARLCRASGITVVHTAHVVRADGSNIGVMGEIIPLVHDGIITKGSASAALHASLEVHPGDILLDKPRFGAFHGTDLEVILRSKGIEAVIICGIATNVCCETTAREANARDFRVYFLSDGTATTTLGNVSADEIQRVTLATLGARFAQVLTVDEMIAKIKSSPIGARA